MLKELTALEESLICPISLEVMTHPVISIKSLQTYNEESIRNALHVKALCPLTQIPMTVDDLRPNYALNSILTTYREMMARIQKVLEDNGSS